MIPSWTAISSVSHVTIPSWMLQIHSFHCLLKRRVSSICRIVSSRGRKQPWLLYRLWLWYDQIRCNSILYKSSQYSLSFSCKHIDVFYSVLTVSKVKNCVFLRILLNISLIVQIKMCLKMTPGSQAINGESCTAANVTDMLVGVTMQSV